MTSEENDTQCYPVGLWKTLRSEKALDEKWFPVRKDTVQLPSGKILDDYFVWDGPVIAMVVPVTPEGNIVLCRQYRHGLGKIIYQLPAGAVDKNETPSQAAIRELEEETGYQSDDVRFLLSGSPYCTKTTATTEMFIAQNARPTGKRHNDELEPTEVSVHTPTEVRQLIAEDQFTDLSSTAAVLYAFEQLGL